MLRRELIHGTGIGLAYLVWHFATFAFGWHENGLALLQGVLFGGIAVIGIGCIWSLSAMVLKDRSVEMAEALRSGLIMAVVVALWAMLGQFLYLKVLHPAYSEYLVEMVRQHYAQGGTPVEEIEPITEQARIDFGQGPMIRQSGLGAFLTGAIASALTLLIVRFRLRR